jgi:acetyltransferase
MPMPLDLPDATLSDPQCAVVRTRGGVALRLRPVSLADAAIVRRFFDALAPEDMRFRFLSARSHLSGELLGRLTEVDHRRSEHLLAFDGVTGNLVASVMLVADGDMQSAEVAIAVRPESKDRGIGWALLNHAVDLARARGIHHLRALESRENHAAIEVERAHGFEAAPYEGDATLVLLEAELS